MLLCTPSLRLPLFWRLVHLFVYTALSLHGRDSDRTRLNNDVMRHDDYSEAGQVVMLLTVRCASSAAQAHSTRQAWEIKNNCMRDRCDYH